MNKQIQQIIEENKVTISDIDFLLSAQEEKKDSNHSFFHKNCPTVSSLKNAKACYESVNEALSYFQQQLDKKTELKIGKYAKISPTYNYRRVFSLSMSFDDAEKKQELLKASFDDESTLDRWLYNHLRSLCSLLINDKSDRFSREYCTLSSAIRLPEDLDDFYPVEAEKNLKKAVEAIDFFFGLSKNTKLCKVVDQAFEVGFEAILNNSQNNNKKEGK